MKRALITASTYFIALFALGFVLGTIRVIFVVPRVRGLAATIAEVPVIATAYFACRWAIGAGRAVVGKTMVSVVNASRTSRHYRPNHRRPIAPVCRQG